MSFDQNGAKDGYRAAQRSLWRRLQDATSTAAGRAAYRYYTWRKDTFSDLLLLLGVSLLLFLVAGWVEGTAMRGLDANLEAAMDSGDRPEWWVGIYAIIKTVFGQDMPGLNSAFAEQLFATATVAVGLASFALVLALVEQVVLEVLTSNVENGGRVWESGHVVLLSWCESAGEVEQVIRLLRQLCLAHRRRPTTIAVLTERAKLEMEARCQSAIPPERRHGCTVVFRRGSPLDPAALDLVSVATASSIIVSGDYSRTPGGSDSQVIRTAILVDEVLAQQAAAAQARGAAGSAPPVVVAQVRSTGAQATARFACGGRVHTVPTKQMNAARMARLIQMPATAAVYRSLSDWGSSAHLAVRPLPPQLAGLTVEQLQLHLPNSVLLGLDRPSSSGTGEEGSPGQGRQLQAPSHGGRDGGMQLNPPADAVVLPGDSLVLLCGQHLDVAMQPLPADEEGDWAPQQLGNSDGAGSWLGAVPPRASITVPESHGQVHLTQSWSVGEGSSGSHLGGGSSGDAHSGAAPAEYRLPQQYLGAARQPQRLLLCGYSDPDLMLALFCALDKGPQALPPGSTVTLFNGHLECWDMLGDMIRTARLENIYLHPVHGDPRSRPSMAQLVDVTAHTAALVLCDPLWHRSAVAAPFLATGAAADGGGGGGPGGSFAGQRSSTSVQGSHAGTLADALRMDAAVLGVQLNIRMLLEAAGCDDINIVSEKLTHTRRTTRFEDTDHLPLGIAVNSASFSANLLAQASVDPRSLYFFEQLGTYSDVAVWDSSLLAAHHEELSYSQLAGRALRCHQAAIIGYYRIPESAHGIELVLNPQGAPERARPRVWNSGDGRCKLLVVAPLKAPDASPDLDGSSAVAPAAVAPAAEIEDNYLWGYEI